MMSVRPTNFKSLLNGTINTRFELFRTAARAAIEKNRGVSCVYLVQSYRWDESNGNDKRRRVSIKTSS